MKLRKPSTHPNAQALPPAVLAKVHAVLPPEALHRLGQRVTASERTHTGQIRVCIEAHVLPHHPGERPTVRDRAVDLFAQQRVWDTEDNNGVLIYLQLAERALEIVADRGLNRHVSAEEWAQIAAMLGESFGRGEHEQGLEHAIDAVTARLVTFFPARPGTSAQPTSDNLPDEPLIL